MEHPEFYEPETLKRLQGEILSILDDFMAVCDKYHLEYFGIAGTGIGAVRHKACPQSWRRRFAKHFR